MNAITYAAARADLASAMDRVCDDHEPVIITRESEQAVVMLSLDDNNALAETAHLLRSPNNARRLLDSIAEFEQGGGTERELVVTRPLPLP
ncbi:type II toxin-antitoxin system prevent-host-death family antitoxin [uncultured Thiodictyon sp.]|uniref:type II toxin-antitoxin system prevent-host-death family antitoxin n=1 Tax=uncultured Thiodictyon sp. TaxID=1846217 RepID=UPI0025EB8248|nr:type II toxin-antitoxin system prevent-host-death family antitoxin [uncultured Thiodictyon sp.]